MFFASISLLLIAGEILPLFTCLLAICFLLPGIGCPLSSTHFSSGLIGALCIFREEERSSPLPGRGDPRDLPGGSWVLGMGWKGSVGLGCPSWISISEQILTLPGDEERQQVEPFPGPHLAWQTPAGFFVPYTGKGHCRSLAGNTGCHSMGAAGKLDIKDGEVYMVPGQADGTV